jgi:adiponectin receptor
MSATYHTISNHSSAVAKFGNRLDYIGIVLLIWGSFVPCIYYGFSSEPQLVRLYWTMITTIAVATLAVVMLPKFRSPGWRPVRAAMFVAMGLSAVAPVVHGLRLYGQAQVERQMALSFVLAQGALYILGAVIYAVSGEARYVVTVS